MPELDNPLRKITISNGLIVEQYEDYIRIIQGKPGQLCPDSVIIPDTDVEALVSTIEELTENDSERHA